LITGIFLLRRGWVGRGDCLPSCEGV